MQEPPSRLPRSGIWAAAKGFVVDWRDDPPATLLWLLLTAAAVGLLKVVGL
jgi:hypothetical protein